MDGIFITGTDTGVGKTLVAAGLLKLIHGSRPVVYWKPVQTGTIVADDTKEVQALTGCPQECFVDPAYRFPEPLSPHVAAEKWGKAIDVAHMTNLFKKQKAAGNFVIVEGAGGLLVPFNSKELQIDFMKALGLPLVIVGEDRVGVINQMLLSVNECKKQGVKILGCILSRARGSFGNAAAIQSFGKIDVLAELQPTQDPKNVLAEVGGNVKLRELFKVPKLPQ